MSQAQQQEDSNQGYFLRQHLAVMRKLSLSALFFVPRAGTPIRHGRVVATFFEKLR